VLLCGNGGSAADAQHFAAELVGRFVTERRPLPAMALTNGHVDPDRGGQRLRLRTGFCAAGRSAVRTSRRGVIGYTTSGNSPNVLEALHAAKKHGCDYDRQTGGDGGKLAKHADQCIIVPSKVTARIQEAHELFTHMICHLLDEAFPVPPSE